MINKTKSWFFEKVDSGIYGKTNEEKRKETNNIRNVKWGKRIYVEF